MTDDLTRAELVELAADVTRRIGSQAEVARRLDVSRAAVNMALRNADDDVTEYDGILMRIVREAGGIEVEKVVRFRVEG